MRTQKPDLMEIHQLQSPQYLRISLAAAMTLGMRKGLFFRGAELRCINLLMTYPEGCRGNCAYCGLQRERSQPDHQKSFIRVDWPLVSLDELISRCSIRKEKVSRICLSMITHRRALMDSKEILARLRAELPWVPLSLLCAPTLLNREELEAFRQIGVERPGIAFDAATKELFDALRGRGVNGPHRWEKYWRVFEQAVEVFGPKMVGVHLIVGLGETEREMACLMGRIIRAGGTIHLFCFFPEEGSMMARLPQPPVGQFRRVQLARYLMEEGMVTEEDLSFNESDQITSFGLPQGRLRDVIHLGIPFMTSGCPDQTGRTVCTRPYGDCRPGEDIRSFPFEPSPRDLEEIESQLATY
jgi:biotin synthase